MERQRGFEQRDKLTQRQRDKLTERQRDGGIERQRNDETEFGNREADTWRER